jgi:hypothetical protein
MTTSSIVIPSAPATRALLHRTVESLTILSATSARATFRPTSAYVGARFRRRDIPRSPKHPRQSDQQHPTHPCTPAGCGCGTSSSRLLLPPRQRQRQRQRQRPGGRRSARSSARVGSAPRDPTGAVGKRLDESKPRSGEDERQAQGPAEDARTDRGEGVGTCDHRDAYCIWVLSDHRYRPRPGNVAEAMRFSLPMRHSSPLQPLPTRRQRVVACVEDVSGAPSMQARL